MDFIKRFKLDSLLLPLIGIGAVLLLWLVIAGRVETRKSVDDFGDPVTKTVKTGISPDLPTPAETWKASKPYLTQPFAKRGELDQGILSFAKLSLSLVMQGYFIALLIGTPLGFCLGLSKTFSKAMDPIIQVLRPVSPLAWFPLGLVLFSSVKLMDSTGKTAFGASDAAALFTIAICSMWPAVMNTAVGVRAVPQDYLNVAKVLKLSRANTLFKVLLPATLPYMFTGFRLSLGIAWLVIVAVEMLTGRPGVGGFLWQEYNAGSYSRIILWILAIGIIGLATGPKVLLLDEPLSALDALTRANLQDEVTRIKREDDTTIVLITNDPDEAILLADRVIPLTAGPNATLGMSFPITIPRPRDRRTIANHEDFKRIRLELVEYLLRSAHNRKTTLDRQLVLPDIEPEDLSVPRSVLPWIGRRGPIRRKEIRTAAVEVEK